MKTLLIVAALFAAPAFAYNDVAIEDAQETVAFLESRLREHKAHESDVVAAKLFLLEMEFAAGKIDRAAWCAQGIPLRLGLMHGTEDLMRRGFVTGAAWVQTKKEYHQIQDFCK